MPGLLLCWTAAAWAAQADLNTAQRAWVSQHPIVSVAPERDYGPFVYADQQGKAQGLSMDFLIAIGEKTGLRFVAAAALPLSMNLEHARKGTVDLLTSLRPTPERAQFLGFTSAYISIPAALIVRAAQPSSLGLRDLAGQRVALGKGYAVESYVRERYPQVQWLALASDEEALAQLMEGKVAGAVTDVASLQFMMRRHGWQQLKIASHIGFDYPLSFAYRKDLPELGAIVQLGLQAISSDERNAIMSRWLEPGPAGTWQNRPIGPMVVVATLLALSAGLLLWRLRLHRSVPSVSARTGDQA